MKFFYLLLLLALPSVIFGQSNYHAGYILKAGGDTIKGFINYREWERSPKKIDFKPSMDNAKATAYAPEAIKGFGVYGFERYVSYIGVVTMSSNDISSLSSDIDTSKKIDTLFLKQVTTGKYVTLYSNKDAIKVRLFIAEPGDNPSELIYYSYINDVQQIAGSSQFIGQLLLIANKAAPGNDRLRYEINTLTYSEPHVAEAVDHINGVSNRKEIKSRFFVGAGLNITTSQTDFANGYDKVNNSTSLGPKIGVGIDFFNNPQVQKLIFRVELSASSAMPRFLYPVTVAAKPAEEVYEYNQYSATITPQILLNIYNKDDFKFYLDAGWSFNFSTYSNNKFTIKNAPADVVEQETIEKPFILEKYWSNFPLQIGVVLHKKIEIYGTYTPDAAYTKYSQFYASNKSIGIGVKLLMGK
jgi:hypothetical protein